MKGITEVSGELSPEVSPTIQLEGPTAEWSFLKGVRLAASGFRRTGAVGTLSSLRLRNPPGSGIIAVVTLLTVSADQDTDFELRIGTETAALPLVVATAVRDSRWNMQGVLAQNALDLSVTNAAGSIGGETPIARVGVLGGTTFIYSVPIVLVPGDSIDGGLNTSDRTLVFSLAWSERQLPALEL